jgi:hypothetical protein
MDAPPRPGPADERYEVRISDPGEVAAALPFLVGFRPRESVVLVALGGASGSQVGVSVRADIPPPGARPAVARDLARGVVSGNPNSVLVLVASEAVGPGGQEPDLPHRGLVHEVVLALGERGLGAREVLLVRGGRWWSYDCPQPCCAPSAGTPLPGGVSELEAASVLAGQVVAEDRAELAARIEPDPRREVATVAALERLAPGLVDAVLRDGPAAAADSWQVVTAAVARVRARSAPPLSDEDAARLLFGLRDPAVRDRAMGLALGPDAAAAEQLWADCTRRAPGPLAAAPATLLAASAWLRGDGAMAGVALARALDSEPGYRLAELLLEGLDACLPPGEIRALIADALEQLGEPSGAP